MRRVTGRGLWGQILGRVVRSRVCVPHGRPSGGNHRHDGSGSCPKPDRTTQAPYPAMPARPRYQLRCRAFLAALRACERSHFRCRLRQALRQKIWFAVRISKRSRQRQYRHSRRRSGSTSSSRSSSRGSVRRSDSGIGLPVDRGCSTLPSNLVRQDRRRHRHVQRLDIAWHWDPNPLIDG